jgi:hypothetical protein
MVLGRKDAVVVGVWVGCPSGCVDGVYIHTLEAWTGLDWMDEMPRLG